jgi:hypothetical protein
MFTGTGDGGPREGVVERVGDAGEVWFRYRRGGREGRGVLNLLRPNLRRAEGRVLNSYIRVRRRDDPPDTRYLAGELLVGFRVGGPPPGGRE